MLFSQNRFVLFKLSTYLWNFNQLGSLGESEEGRRVSIEGLL